jgi:hypothetical protein
MIISKSVQKLEFSHIFSKSKIPKNKSDKISYKCFVISSLKDKNSDFVVELKFKISKLKKKM